MARESSVKNSSVSKEFFVRAFELVRWSWCERAPRCTAPRLVSIMPKAGHGHPPPGHPGSRAAAEQAGEQRVVIVVPAKIVPATVIKPCGSSCGACGAVICLHCGEEARLCLDAAAEGAWERVEAVLAVRPELLNYQPDRGERSNAGPHRRAFCLLHWAALDGDEARIRRLTALPGCNARVLTRDGKSASAVAIQAKNYRVAGLLRATEDGVEEFQRMPPPPPPTPAGPEAAAVMGRAFL